MSRECPDCHQQIPIFRQRLVVRYESSSGSRWSRFAPKRPIHCPRCDAELKFKLLPGGYVLFILALGVLELARRYGTRQRPCRGFRGHSCLWPSAVSPAVACASRQLTDHIDPHATGRSWWKRDASVLTWLELPKKVEFVPTGSDGSTALPATPWLRQTGHSGYRNDLREAAISGLRYAERACCGDVLWTRRTVRSAEQPRCSF